jgi:hypothetical protein
MTALRCATMAAVLALVLAGGGCGKKEKGTVEEKLPSLPLHENLIKNPSFEEWEGTSPLGWRFQQFEGVGRRPNLFGSSSDEKVTGNASFYLRGMWDVNQWQVLVQRFPIIPGYRLSFSAAMKSKDLKTSKGQKPRANMYVRFYDKDGKRVNERYYADSDTPYLLGTREWRQYGKTTDIPKEARTAEIGLINQMTGWLYFDDVEAMLEKPIPWKEVQKEHVDFYYLKEYPYPAGAIDKQETFVDDCIKKFHIKLQGKISYYYYGTEENVRTLLGTRRGHGRAVWKLKELHTAKSFDDHEIIHMVLADYGNPPFGLAEGLVFYILGSWEGKDLNMIAKELLLQQQLPALHGLLKLQDMNERGLSNVVPGWASFTIWLINRNGIDKFMKLYADTGGVDEIAPFNERFREIYGKDFDVVDRDWRLWVLRYQPKL